MWLWAMAAVAAGNGQSIATPSAQGQGLISEIGVPKAPTYSELTLPELDLAPDASGVLQWLGMAQTRAPLGERFCNLWRPVVRRWNPATGDHASIELPLTGFVTAQTPMAEGIVFVLVDDSCAGPARQRIGLYRRGEVQLAELDAPGTAFGARLLVLNEDVAALVTRDKESRHLIVHRVSRSWRGLTVQRMPELAIPYRNDYAVVALDAHQLMVLGGSNGDYRGCWSCRADTHVLDLQLGAWRDGPSMLEPRSELGAARLPDGSVLVSGGWTPSAGWGPGPSRTAERWRPGTDRFEALPPMPTGDAQHRSFWWTAGGKRMLWMVGGLSNSLPAFDPDTLSWANAASWPQGSEEGACAFFPFVKDGQTYAWHWYREESHYSTKSCDYRQTLSLSTLRWGAPQPEPSRATTVPPQATYRGAAAFVPARGREPALWIGGATHAGMNSSVVTATVEAMDRDGGLWPMPSLQEARSGARAWRLAGGVLVAGGHAGSVYDLREQGRLLPMEWLPTAGGHQAAAWLVVQGQGPAAGNRVEAMPDGSLIELDSEGQLHRLTLVRDERSSTPLKLTREPWATPLLRAPRDADGSRVQLRALQDGRVVVAGGEGRSERIALWDADSVKQQGLGGDRYVGVGLPEMPDQYDILDPQTGQWHSSAASSTIGGQWLVRDDGRVLQIGGFDGEGQARSPLHLSVSTPDGLSWQHHDVMSGWEFKAEPSPSLFVHDGEVFARGQPQDEAGQGRAVQALQWLDVDAGRWTTVWRAGARDNWPSLMGLSVVVTLPSGRSLLVPMEGS